MWCAISLRPSGPRAPCWWPAPRRRPAACWSDGDDGVMNGSGEGTPRIAGLAGMWKETTTMLTTILVLLVVLWLLGMVSSYTLGGFIHILLVLAVAILLIRVIQGRNPVV